MAFTATAPSISIISLDSGLESSNSSKAIPPEIVAEIQSYLPIVYRPAALMSLALTCRSLCGVIIPGMLYNAVWLEGEGRALPILSRFNTQLSQGPQLSRYIRYLSIVSELSKKVREGPTNVLRELRALISAGGLRNLVAFTLHLEDGWFWANDRGHALQGFGELDRPFWEALAKNCPLITRVHLTGIAGFHHDNLRWIDDSGVLEFKALRSLRIVETSPSSPEIGFLSQVCNSDSKSLIEVLELPVPARFDLFIPTQFSNLRTLILEENIRDGLVFVSGFWRNHSKLERIELGGYITGNGGFSGMSSSWFPNLQTLKCTFFTAKALLPHVHSQLINLTLVDSVNAQALYLLRFITPNGTMAQLRSLGIQLVSSRVEAFEGNTWYEDRARTSTWGAPQIRYFDANYVATLSKAAPNLEELELIGHSKGNIEKIASSLQHFRQLHTLILSGAAILLTPAFFRSSVHWSHYANPNRRYMYDPPSTYKPSSLQDAVSHLGNGCRTLEQIRFSSHIGQLFHHLDLTAVIVRNGIAGPVRGLKIRKGWGRLIGREDEW